MGRTVPFLNVCISFVAFITALSLVAYMLVSFVTGTYDVAIQIFDTIFLEPADRQVIIKTLNVDFLHTIALLIVLMKAYRILVEYMRWYHIDIKYMMEIGIIAPVLELLFNYQNYTEDMRYILLAIAVSFAAIYSFKHDVLVQAMRESRNENLQWRKEGKASLQELEEEVLEDIEKELAVVPKKRASRVVAKKVASRVSTKK